MGKFQQKLNAIWYQNQSSMLNLLLVPLSLLFKIALILRNKLLKKSLKENPVPVLVVGNLTVGGSGKTPAIISLIEYLQQKGFHPGVISRGYPISPEIPVCVHAASSPQEVGDEALLIFMRSQVPVCVCRNRPAAIQMLMTQNVNIILSDDGLQNFSFKHDLELVLYDQTRQFGNQKLLPAGPLREPLTRLRQINFLLEKKFTVQSQAEHNIPPNTWHDAKTIYPFALKIDGFVRLVHWGKQAAEKVSANYFQHKKVLAMTAIANPESFFASLSAQGIQYDRLAFQDHYAFQEKDFAAYVDYTIIMTEKDAVKSLHFSHPNLWVMPLIGSFSLDFEKALSHALECFN